MNTQLATHNENRWVMLSTFCERTGIKLCTARYFIKVGKLHIKPKVNPKDRVFVDWFSWNAGKKIH